MFGGAGKTTGPKLTKEQQETEPERIYNLKRCCDLLVAGGYFRARIATLTPFDRVVGGLVWALTASNVDLDVDIVFTENSSIRQRIKLSENVIRALVKMGYPHQIQAQQIQGLDYLKLYDVIQWVLKMVYETRELTGDLIRALSESQFSKNYSYPADTIPEAATDHLLQVVHQYRPKRLFKRKANANIASVSARTEAALLEYGEKFYRAYTDIEDDQDKANAAFEKKRASLLAKYEAKDGGAEGKKKSQEELKKKKAEEEEQRLDALRRNLAEVGTGGDTPVQVSGLIDSDQIDYYDAELKRQQALSGSPEDMGLTGKKALLAAFNRQVENLRKKIADQQQQVVAAQELSQRATTKVETVRASLLEKARARDQASQEQANLDKMEREHVNQAVLAQLKALVAVNESLKKQESQFKASCKEQMNELQSMIAKLDTDDGDEEIKRMFEIERIYAEDLAKLSKMRQALAQKNQEIARIVRAIDDIPTRAELIQYERRFVELYELVAEKLVETRKYFSLYNTLEETHRFLTNEVSLLESIAQNFPKAQLSTKGMDMFLESFKEIMDNLQINSQNVDKSLGNEQATKETLVERNKKLLEKQRRYFKAVKEFQDECYKNEKLSDALQNIKQAQGKAP